MLIVHNTDAPIYHRPIATIGVIVVNCLVGLASIGMSEEMFEMLLLQYQYFRPWQWITSQFLHADIVHLLGNMFALWGFGLVIEGKIGTPKFLLVYGLIALLSALLEHPFGFLFGNSGSLGASGIVFGLMAMALIWAPKNNVSCIFMLGFRPIPFETPILTLVGGMCILQIAMMTFSWLAFAESRLSMSSEILHLVGAAVGGGIAIIMLQRKLVDCEGWDIISVATGEGGKQKEVDDAATFERKVQHNTEQSLQDVRNFLQANQPGAAKAAHIEARQFVPNWILPEPESAALIEALCNRYLWKDAVEVMVEYLQYHQQRATTVRVLLAKVCLERLNQPLQALKVLAKLDLARLPAEAVAEVERLKAIALPQAEEDPYEIVNDW